MAMTNDSERLSPLQTFLYRYVEASGGVWEDVEPGVIDVLLADADKPERLTFDSDALAEHPGAQFFTFGSAALDDLLARAVAQGKTAEVYATSARLPSQGEAYWRQRIEREFTRPERAAFHLRRIGVKYVRHTIFWFEATYLSDEKEQVLYSSAVDRLYGRQARYLDGVTRPNDERSEGQSGEFIGKSGWTFSESRSIAYPDAPSIPLYEAYARARDRVLRTLAADANTRRKEMGGRLQRQIGRISHYFEDLRDELQARIDNARHKLAALETPFLPETDATSGKSSAKAQRGHNAKKSEPAKSLSAKEKKAREEFLEQDRLYRQSAAEEMRKEIASLEERVQTLNREEASRIEDVRKKSVLRISVRLAQYLHIKIPRIVLDLAITPPPPPSHRASSGTNGEDLVNAHALRLSCTYDGAPDRLDAIPCPHCAKPTYQLLFQTSGQTSLWGCPACLLPSPPQSEVSPALKARKR